MSCGTSTGTTRRRARNAAATVLVATALAAACGGASRNDGEETGGSSPTGGDPNTGGTADGGTPNGGAVNASGASGGGGNGATAGGSGNGGTSGDAPGGGLGGAPSGGASSGGASDGGSGGGAPSGGVSGGEGGSPSGGAPSGGAPTGGMTTGGAQTGGASGQPSCPASPPTDGDPCGEDQACFYEDCEGAGQIRAGCLDSVWHVRTTPCCPDTVPTSGETCPGDDYYCVYGGDCPGGDVSELRCYEGEWSDRGLPPRPCCPDDPPGSDAVTCGPDMLEERGSAFIQYECAWQDCGSYGTARADCSAAGTMTSTASGSCERFFCGNGNTDPDYYCEAGQVCVDFGLVEYVVGGGHVFRCADNPCAPGVVELGCAREFICPTTELLYVPYGTGIYVVCRL